MIDARTKILVWDAPVRVFHWLLVLSFAGAYLSAESERWRLLHVSLGYTMAGLLAFRVLWGLVGTRYARFAGFVRSPAAVVDYLRSLLNGRAQHHLGHNPAGAVAIMLLLLLSAIAVASGWAVYNDVGGDWLEDWHEGAANFMLAVVGVHVAGVVVSSWLHRENLVGAMLSGKKAGAPADAISRPLRGLAMMLLAAVLGYWWLQWQSSPAPIDAGALVSHEGAKSNAREHDD